MFAATMCGLLAALIDWALLRKPARRGSTPERAGTGGPEHPVTTTPTRAPHPDPIIARAQRRPIVFRETGSVTGLSFYGGAPISSSSLAWPRNKQGEVPLSFLMQWDCTALASQDATGLLPPDGVLYLFADLGWSDFRFIHVPGPVSGWHAAPVPADLPPLYGNGGGHQVPYCSPLLAPERQDVPVLLPKWPFTPVAFSYPAAPAPDDAGLFWSESDAVAEALLHLEHPEGVPPAKHLNKQQSAFDRPFAAFPHDYAAVRIVAAKVLDHLRYPSSRYLREAPEQQREAALQRWRDEATERYTFAAAHHPAAKVNQSEADEMWQWMQELEPLLRLGWGSLVDECVNVSLGLSGEAGHTLPTDLVAVCMERHQIASAYLHEEYPDRRNPEALAAWEQRKAEGTLKEVRTLHAPCPNHMFGPPSYVQGYVEEHLDQMVLLLELSTRQPIGHEFGEGVLQFMIRPTDLREGRFDKAMLIASAY
jgi:hypothetical protein